MKRECERCRGRGEVVIRIAGKDAYAICPTCGGTGKE